MKTVQTLVLFVTLLGFVCCEPVYITPKALADHNPVQGTNGVDPLEKPNSCRILPRHSHAADIACHR